jgi:diguanylate cyclase (GGDEF)-like protein/PAS domain S-box-containing protein
MIRQDRPKSDAKHGSAADAAPSSKDATQLQYRADGSASGSSVRDSLSVALEKTGSELFPDGDIGVRQFVDQLPDAVILVDARTGQTLYANAGYERIWGRGSASVCEHPQAWREHIHPDDLVAVTFDFTAASLTDERDNEFRVIRPDGELRSVRSHCFPIRDAGGRIECIVRVFEDVTAAAEQQRKNAHQGRRLAMLSSISTAIMHIKDQRQLLEEACRIVVIHGGLRIAWIAMLQPGSPDGEFAASHGAPPGYFDQERVTAREGLVLSSLPGSRALREKRAVVSNDLDADPSPATRKQLWLDQGIGSVAAFPIVADGRTLGALEVLASKAGTFDLQETQALAEFAGILAFGMQTIEREQRLHFLNYYDALTNLPNHALFDDRVAAALRTADDNGSLLSIMLVDIDGFMLLNESMGRAVGDIVLKTLASRLQESLQEPHFVARIAADTFAVAVGDLRNAESADVFLREKILPLLSQPVIAEGREVRVTATAGAALYPTDGKDSASLIRNAQGALKRAQSAHLQHVFCSPAPTSDAREKLALDTRLRHAYEKQQFVLHYQPKMAARDGRIAGLEALIRWNDPDAGMIAPRTFIGPLESSGLILQVGEWAMQQALRDHARWRRRDLQPPRVALNVSAVQLRNPGFVDTVRNAIEASDSLPEALELEITEGLMIEDMETSTHSLQKLRDLGVSIAIDDFGTGYSSLRYLARLPVDSLKIDRSFVATMIHEPDSMTIVSTVITLAHALHLQVVAEGVETEEQLKLLNLMRCDEHRGFLFSRPLPEAACAELLSQRKEMMATGAFRRHRVM